MRRNEIVQWLVNTQHDDVILYDGFEEAFIGVVSVYSRPDIAVYNMDTCLNILMKRDSMDYEGAREYMDFNVTGAWVGEHTPGFVTRFETEKE